MNVFSPIGISEREASEQPLWYASAPPRPAETTRTTATTPARTATAPRRRRRRELRLRRCARNRLARRTSSSRSSRRPDPRRGELTCRRRLREDAGARAVAGLGPPARPRSLTALYRRG